MREIKVQELIIVTDSLMIATSAIGDILKTTNEQAVIDLGISATKEIAVKMEELKQVTNFYGDNENE